MRFRGCSWGSRKSLILVRVRSGGAWNQVSGAHLLSMTGRTLWYWGSKAAIVRWLWGQTSKRGCFVWDLFLAVLWTHCTLLSVQYSACWHDGGGNSQTNSNHPEYYRQSQLRLCQGRMHEANPDAVKGWPLVNCSEKYVFDISQYFLSHSSSA